MKVCVITMVYGFTGTIHDSRGGCNINVTTNTAKQFVLDPDVMYNRQILDVMTEMSIDASEWYKKSCHSVARDFGNILSHSVTVFEHG